MKIALIVIAVVTYGAQIYAALTFFAAEDSAAKTGKRIVSFVGATATGTSLFVLSGIEQQSPPGIIIALSLFAVSFSLFWWTFSVSSNVKFAFLGSADKPRVLVTSGPFRRVRHPFYASYILGWIAPFAAAPSPLTLCILVTMSALYVVASVREEKIILASEHAAAYSVYVAHTGRFTPRLFARQRNNCR